MSNENIISANADGTICTVDQNSKNGRKNLVNALSASTSLAKSKFKTFTVIDIVLTKGVRSQTGADCFNTYLILKDGNALMSQSDGIARAARNFAEFMLDDLHSDGVEMMVVQQPLDNGRTIKTLQLV